MGVQRMNPVWRAEYFRELRRYFSSHIYVSNTLVIYVLMLACVAALAVTETKESQKRCSCLRRRSEEC